MIDLYSQIVNSPRGRLIAPRVGLPRPAELRRRMPGEGDDFGAVLVGAAPGGRLAARLELVVAEVGAAVPQTGTSASARWSSTRAESPTRPRWSSCSASSTPT